MFCFFTYIQLVCDLNDTLKRIYKWRFNIQLKDEDRIIFETSLRFIASAVAISFIVLGFPISLHTIRTAAASIPSTVLPRSNRPSQAFQHVSALFNHRIS